MIIEVNLPEEYCIIKDEQEIRIILASSLYDKGVIALGYAAESVGLEKRTLIEEMGKYNVHVLKLNDNDIQRILKNARNN